MYDSSFSTEGGQEHDHKIEDFKDDGESPKLFVGQVPRQLTDQDLRKVFEPYGIISEITILRDRITGAHKGCAFVTYANRSSAEKAIEAVHNKITLHHTKRPVQVRFAGKENEPKGDIKLFVGMLSKTTTESTIMELFSMYGKVKEVYLMKDHNQKSKGCAFVKFENRLDAQKAIAGLHDIYQDEGAPRKISVKYADTKEERMQRQMAKQFNQYNPYAMASGVGGRGVGTSGFPSGMGGFGGGSGFGPSGGFPPPSGFGPPTGFGAPSGFGAPTGFGGMYSPPTEFGGGGFLFGGGGGRIQQQTRGPPGANVFIYNIPDAFTDHDLQSMFSNFGNVLSALVFKDKVTGVSRGFGFVSYDSPSAAEKAIVALNGFHVGNKRLKVMLKKNGTSGVSGGGGTGSQGRGFSPY